MKQEIRGAILQGRYRQDERLPSLEELAREMKVAGVTAKRAVDELAEEGWLESRQGVGTFVRVRQSQARVMLTAPRKLGWETFLSAKTLGAFHAQHPNVQITLSSEPNTDLVVTNSYALVVDSLRGQELLSLDELSNRFKYQKWQLPAQMRALAANKGELFGLPLRVDLVLMQVNPELCPISATRSGGVHLTWEQYKDILNHCRQDRDGDGFVECFGGFSKLALYEWLIPFWQRGGRLDDREAFFSDAAFKVLDELWQMHHVARTLPVEMSFAQSEVANAVIRQRFHSRQVATRWIPSVSIFESSPFPTAVMLPRFGPVAKQEVYATLLGVHRDCTHPDVAMQFLDFCHRRFIRDNQEYPFALSEEHRQALRQMPAIQRMLQEGLADAIEPLREGIPQRTWALEREVFDWFRLLQNRQQMVSRLHKHWDRWGDSAHGALVNPSSLIHPWSETMSPLGNPF